MTPEVEHPGSAVTPAASPWDAPTDAERYEEARKRVAAKRKFHTDVAAYVLVNLFLIGIWWFTGHGSFWPGWVLAGWGLFLLLDGWNAYMRRPVTRSDIERELQRGR